MNHQNNDFPFGIGVGSSTGCEIECEFCGKVHNQGYDVDRDGKEGESVRYIDFLGKTMAECCFRQLEEDVFRKREYIINWLDELARIKCNQAVRDSLSVSKGQHALTILK